MIVCVGNTKGGVGKTTISVNLTIALARQGDDVLLVDGDEQGTSLAFTELRYNKLEAGPGYTAVALQGAALRTQVRQLCRRYAHVIVDVGGRDTGSLRAALTVANLFLLPVAPRSFDLWAADQTGELVRQAREVNDGLRAVAFLNMADVAGTDNGEALAALGELDGIEISDCSIVRRKAWSNAASQGLSVLEYNPRGEGSVKALADFTRLFNSIFPERKLKTL